MMTGAGNNSMASEYVKQELRTTVSARMQQSAGSPRNLHQNMGMAMQQQQQPDLSSLGFEMSSSGGNTDGPKSWANDLGAVSPQPSLARNNTEDQSRTGVDTPLLLQQLLSDHRI